MTPETLGQITAIFGWMTIVNILLYTYAAFFIVFKRDWIMGLHSRLLGVEQDGLETLYFSYLGNYKIVIITMNLVPWIALKIVG